MSREKAYMIDVEEKRGLEKLEEMSHVPAAVVKSIKNAVENK